MVSASPTRDGAVALDGAVLPPSAYVFLRTGTSLATVSFYVDDEDASSSPYRVERYAAYDLGGTAPDGRAQVFDATALATGRHTLTTITIDRAGTKSSATVAFSTADGGTPPTPPDPSGTPRLLIGMGPQSTGAERTALATEAPVRMLTSWYNGPGDLDWMTRYLPASVPGDYAAGYAMHLIVYAGGGEEGFAGPRGQTCGRKYPLSDQFLGDMQRLARTFAGTSGGPPLYVTMFTEFQTYPCIDNLWSGSTESTSYYLALKDRYLQARDVFRANAPNAKVSLGWGGWQMSWDDPARGGGRSLVPHFEDVMRASDFQSFQAMDSGSNAGHISDMTRMLGQYGPVMLAHYKPDSGSSATFESDVRALFTDDSVRALNRDGLFAFSFMDNANLSSSPGTYGFVRDAVHRYGVSP